MSRYSELAFPPCLLQVLPYGRSSIDYSSLAELFLTVWYEVRKNMRDIFAAVNPSTSLRVFNLFVETAHAVLKDADNHLNKAAGLSASKFVVLMVLAFSEGTMTAAKLAERTGTKPHNITKLIERMKRDGLIMPGPTFLTNSVTLKRGIKYA